MVLLGRLAQSETGDGAVIEGFEVDGNDGGLGRSLTDGDSLLTIHDDDAVVAEMGTAGVGDDDVELLMFKYCGDGFVPNGVTGPVDGGFIVGAEEEAGDVAHAFGPLAGAVLGRGAADGDALPSRGAGDGENGREAFGLNFVFITGLAEEGQGFGQ